MRQYRSKYIDPPLFLLVLSSKAPLGMENGAISDAQISASSRFNDNYAPQEARLNNKERNPKQGVWVAARNDINPWLQVDLDSYSTVTGVATQGRSSTRWGLQWVKTFKIQYSLDGFSFQTYKEPGNSSEKVNWHSCYLTILGVVREQMKKKLSMVAEIFIKKCSMSLNFLIFFLGRGIRRG